MMKSKKVLIIGAIISLLFTACNKKEGCTDALAENYDSEVKSKNDDGSCTFNATLSVWWSESYAQSNVDDGYGTMSIFFDGDLVDSKSANLFYTSEPTCDDGVSKTFDLGGDKSKSVVVKVVLEGSTIYQDYTSESTVVISTEDECLLYKWN